MANLHDTFLEFNDIIYLSSKKKSELRTSRNSIREDITKYFIEKRDKHTVKYKGQGSFSTNTCILPISGEYDVDDGVYIFGKEEDRPTPQTAHNWIYEAVKDRTDQHTVDKNTCVRVQYAKKYHVDLPIYYKPIETNDEFFYDSENISELAHKSKGWIKSDPYAFRKWFDKKASDRAQLKRIIRYLKDWIDNKSDLKLPSGMVFTILAVEHYSPMERDDETLLNILEKIQEAIDDVKFKSASYSCYRPTVDTTENLMDKYSSETRKKDFLRALDSFIISGKQALILKSKKDACAKWQRHLGSRFPCANIVEDDEQLAKSFAFPGVIRNNKSA